MNPSHQKGAINELKAQEWFLSQGYYVYTPVVQHGVVDFVIEKDGKPETVQVKSAFYVKTRKYNYLTCRLGRRTSNTRTAHTADMYDILFVIYNDTFWLIRKVPNRQALYFNPEGLKQVPYDPNEWIVSPTNN